MSIQAVMERTCDAKVRRDIHLHPSAMPLHEGSAYAMSDQTGLGIS